MAMAWLLLSLCLGELPEAQLVTDETAIGGIQLCREVSALRSDLPSYVVKLGHLYEARQSLSKKRRLRLREHKDSSPLWSSSCLTGGATGPWRLKIDLAAPSTAPTAFRKHHRAILVFGKTWPQSLPSIRFVGQLKSLYVKPPDEDKSDHVREASSKLLARLQEAASGGRIACMWRQTANCNATHGEREPDRDRLCSENVPLGNSGFCDCNGDNQKNSDELGYGCQSTPGNCETVCPQALQDRRYDLKWLLWQLHRSLGGAMHPKDEKPWQLAATAFEEDASTVVKYQSYGPKHAMFFKTNGVELEKAIDPRM
ncbi:unnamed protein product [Cladocopium goreaui]|uniref:PKHD-type hydroxylase n=1 Tax=Cladocopium goreaui TaxID=2562237 RepID=A0A9P1D7Z7_9DINO|nr:unnamed protein product [Cladocopium goreaui]